MHIFSEAAGHQLDQLNRPSSIARDDATGTLYISDTENHRMMKHLPGPSNGSVVAGGNGQGTANNQLNFPAGIYFDSKSNSLVIANRGANNIIRWPIGAAMWSLLAGDSSGMSGSSSTLLNGPRSVTFDSQGNMYVADTGNHRIQLFKVGETAGITIAGVTGKNDSTASLLNNPYSAKLDNQGNLYVVDTDNQRIQKFKCTSGTVNKLEYNFSLILLFFFFMVFINLHLYTTFSFL